MAKEKQKPLLGKIALVTGASRGVGKGAALGLGEAGATVYVTGRTVEPGDSPFPGSLSETAAEITALGGEGIAYACDHGDDDAVEQLVKQLNEAHGAVDILVNNVFALPADLTLWSQGSFWEQPLSMWDDQINIGLRSHYVASWFAIPAMIEKGQGLIVNISSSGAKQYHLNVAYGVGKAGVDKLTFDMATELQQKNIPIAVISLWPGMVRTERIQESLGEGLADITSESPTFTGRAIAYLAQDPKVMERSGKRLIVYQLAEEYGFTDVDGTIPNAHDYL